MPDSTVLFKVEGLACLRCGAKYPADLFIDSKGCPACWPEAPANLEVVYSESARAWRTMPSPQPGGGFAPYADYLPVSASELLCLGEGATPLIEAPHLANALDIAGLALKDESRNPTWSHKDRYSVVAVSYARRQGHRFVATASSGNAGASLAAYAAKAGMGCLVLTYEGAAGPLVEQIRRYGAVVIKLRDKLRRWPILAEGASRFGWFVTSPFRSPVVGSHPYGIEGYKTIAYEIAAQFSNGIPDWVVVPTAYGDVLHGIWKGFTELHDARHISRRPRLAAAEIYGSLSKTLSGTADALAVVEADFPTQAHSIGTLQGSYQSLISLRNSCGVAETVDDAALWEMQGMLARREGILGELSGVAAVAAARQMRRKGVIGPGESVVCLMTATGLKDIDQQPLEKRGEHVVAGGLDEVMSILAAELDPDIFARPPT